MNEVKEKKDKVKKIIDDLDKLDKVIAATDDNVFKSLFQSKESLEALIYLISEITTIDYDYIKENITFKNTELPKSFYMERGKIADLVVDIKGSIINLEMNHTSGDIVKNWQTFPFHSLTEDYELTLYSIENNLTSNYNKNAIFYDEQPVEYNKTINQRMRWIRGYFDNQRKYVPKFFKMLKNNPNYASLLTEITGMWPYILMIIGAILYILGQLGNIILGNDIRTAILKIFLVIIGAYTLFVGLVTYVILKDEDKINLSKAMQVKVTFFAPLFFVTYIPCALKALFKKEVKWEKTEHNRTLKQKID